MNSEIHSIGHVWTWFSWIQIEQVERRILFGHAQTTNLWWIHSYTVTILQVDVDIGSSAVANGVLGLVFGVVTTLVVDMAFLI